MASGASGDALTGLVGPLGRTSRTGPLRGNRVVTEQRLHLHKYVPDDGGRPNRSRSAPRRSINHPLTRTLLVLTFTTGLVDGVSYLGLGHVFTANMTGNIVLLGFGIAGG